MTQRFFFRETEKSFREISGKGPDEKNYCITGFPGVPGKFPGNFPRVSGKFPGSRNSSSTGPPPGFRGLTLRREFRWTGTRSRRPITCTFGVGGQGRGLRRSCLLDDGRYHERKSLAKVRTQAVQRAPQGALYENICVFATPFGAQAKCPPILLAR